MLLAFADACVILVALIVSCMLRLGYEPGLEYFFEHLPTVGGSCMIFMAVFYAAGMYDQQVISQKNYATVASFVAVVISIILIILVFYARFQLHIGRGVMGLAGIFVFVNVAAVRALYRLGLGQGFFCQPTLIVGEGAEVEQIVDLINKQRNPYYKFFGVVVTDRNVQAGSFIRGVPVLGGIDQLREFVHAYSIQSIIVGTSHAREYELLSSLRPLRYAGIELLDFVSLHEELAFNIPLEHIDDEWLMHAAMNSSRIHIRKMKRMLDVFVASAGLIVTLPISLFVCLVVPLESRGGIFYRQKRVGLEGKIYTVLKFRSMQSDAEADSGAVWAGRTDARVTRVGKFLRTTRIDEIPQLLNVLRGNMSLVGPRPERPEFVKTLSENIPFYQERLLVPPGITGWAQVKHPYAASIHASRIKLQYDLYYVKHMSLFLDVAILLKTFKTILAGIRHSEEDDELETRTESSLKVVSSDSEDEKLDVAS